HRFKDVVNELQLEVPSIRNSSGDRILDFKKIDNRIDVRILQDQKNNDAFEGVSIIVEDNKGPFDDDYSDTRYRMEVESNGNLKCSTTKGPEFDKHRKSIPCQEVLDKLISCSRLVQQHKKNK